MKKLLFIFCSLWLNAQESYPVEWEVVAKIREEGFQRSEISNTLSYMTDVLGARLTNSEDMRRAQDWAVKEMQRIGLRNIEIEPFMDYGVSWDNTFFSLHMIEPDYQTMVGYPIAHTPGINGRQKLEVVRTDIKTKADLDRYRGQLRGKAVLASPQVSIDQNRYRDGVARYTEEQLKAISEKPLPKPPRGPRGPVNPDLVGSEERNAFFKAEGVAVILESRSGWIAAVRGFARPGAKKDKWDRKGTIDHLPLVAVTPEHYNRMVRITERDIPVKIDIEIQTKIGRKRQEARNVLGEISGTDLKDEVVMLGAHFDTWHASPNASDNTSGVAVMLEAMRCLLYTSPSPRD